MGLLLIKFGSVEVRPRPLWKSHPIDFFGLLVCFFCSFFPFFMCFFSPMLSITDKLRPPFETQPRPLSCSKLRPPPFVPCNVHPSTHPFFSPSPCSGTSSSSSIFLSFGRFSFHTLFFVFLSFHVFRLSVT